MKTRGQETVSKGRRSAEERGRVVRRSLKPWIWETAVIRRRHINIDVHLLHDAVWEG